MRLLAFAAAAGLLAAGSALRAMEFLAPGRAVVPAVKKSAPAAGSFRLGETLTAAAPERCEMALAMLGEALAERGVALKRVAGKAGCVFALSPEFDDPEAYRLEITSGGIRISASSDRGLFYGAQTLIPLVRGAAGRELAGCVIDDRPDLKVRGMHFTMRFLDASNLGDFKRMVRALASLKYNTLLLEFADNFPYEDNPFTLRKSTVTRAELEELVAWIRAHKIEIIPQIQLGSHVRALATHPRFPELLEAPPKLKSLHDAALCPSNPEACELLRKMIREQLAFFEPKVFDLCFDEFDHCPFRVCPKCRARQPEEILRGLLDMASEIVFAAGAVPQVYHDSFLPGKAGRGERVLPGLDRRFRITVWNYNDDPGFEHRIFASKGFPVVTMPIAGSPANVAVLVKYAKHEKLAGTILTFWYHWRHVGPELLPFTGAGYGGLVYGAELCWNPDGARETLPCDPVAEMRFRLGIPPEPARSGWTPLPIAGAVNAELGGDPEFPVFDGAKHVRLAAEAAAAPEKFAMLFRGHRYYGVLAGGGAGTPGRAEIPVGAKAAEFAFLLSATRPANTMNFLRNGRYGAASTPKVGEIRIHYADRTGFSIPLKYRESVVDWSYEFGGLKMRQFQRDADGLGRVYSFGVTKLVNPHPDKEVVSLTFSGGGEFGIAPLLLAVSVRGAGRSFAPSEIEPARIVFPPRQAPAPQAEVLAPAAAEENSGLRAEAIPPDADPGIPSGPRLPIVRIDCGGRPGIRFTVPAMAPGRDVNRVTVKIPVRGGIHPEFRSLRWEFRIGEPAAHKYNGVFVAAPAGNRLPCLSFFDHSVLGRPERRCEANFSEMRRSGLKSTANAREIWVNFWLVNREPVTIELLRVGVSREPGKYRSAARVSPRL